jgi:hypothetical protein
MNIGSEQLKLVAQMTSTLVALVALVIGLRNETRNQKRFERQLELSSKVAAASARPLLALAFEGYGDRKGIILQNHGPGTAVITDLWCCRGQQRSKDLAELFDLGWGIPFEELSGFPDGTYYIPGKTSEVIVRLTQKDLEEAGKKNEASQLLEELERQIDEFSMVVTYQDVLGNEIARDAQLK